MTYHKKLELIELAKSLTGETNLNILMRDAKKLHRYFSEPFNKPEPETLNMKFASSFEDFYSNHLHIPTVDGMITKFIPYTAQLKFADFITTENQAAIATPRQMGSSTIMAAYMLWFSIYHNDKTIILAASRMSQVTNHIEHILKMYENIDGYKVGITKMTKHFIEFENGSRILGRTATANACRGMGVSLIVVPDATSISHSIGDEFWESLLPYKAVGDTQIILQSCGGSKQSFFYHSLFQLSTLRLSWRDVEHFDTAWAMETRKLLGDEKFSIEYCSQFKD